MANLHVLNGAGDNAYLKGSGAQSDADPFIPEHLETNSANVLTALQTLAGIVSAAKAAVTLATLPDTAAGDLAAIAAAIAGTLTTDVSSVTLPTTPYYGQKTVTTAGTAVALASSQAILSGVTIKALAGNSGNIYVGDSSVGSANGFVLAAGEQVFIEIANLSTVYLDSDNDGEGVSYLAS